LISRERSGRLERHVTLLRYQGQGSVLARYLASADALVHAGDNETFGLVLAEAMACGRPVVGVNAGAVPEIVDSSVGVLVPRARGDLLAEGVQALFEQDIDLLGQQARRRVESQYSWDQVLQRLLALYRRLAGVPEPAEGESQHVLR
jgi:alpha-1,6-mannosyltransferase